MMSSRKKQIIKNNQFVSRFIEVCGSSQPAEISKKLGISYQAAKNYLSGRLPEPHILISISEKTGYSIHWLLTGEGRKYIDESFRNEAEIFLSNVEKNVDPTFLRRLNQFFYEDASKIRHTNTTPPKTVTLTPDKVKNEKEKDGESKTLLEKED